MASYLDKAQVNTAITDNTKLDLGHQHITNIDFMELQPSYIHEMVPGEKIDVKMETFARLNPLPVPTFGRASMRHRAFFVPFRTIFRGWDDFITDNVHVASDGPSGATNIWTRVPVVDMVNLIQAFTADVGTDVNSPNMVYPVLTSTDPIDIVVQNQPTTTFGFNFTIIGRQCIKILESLGYKLDPSIGKEGDMVVSALPLLALAKVYVDWYFPQQYSNLQDYDYLLSLCNYDVSSGSINMTASAVRTILKSCAYVQFDSDYFVSAWDQPNSPNAGNYSDFKLVNIDTITNTRGVLSNNTGVYTYSENGYVSNNSASVNINDYVGGADAPFITPYVKGAASNGNYQGLATPISQYLLHSLHALTDYLKRNQISGARNFDRYLARFGKALPAEKLNRSVYLGASVQDIQIGDIMSTSDTAGANLGAYAGKGMSYGNGHFDFDTNEYGYFIILSSLVPATGYFQGIDRQVMRTTKLDFWIPEFDSLGAQPITANELYVPQDFNLMTVGNGRNQIFGFTPRYADYKVSHDQLTGNFRLRSINGTYGDAEFNAADSWHLMRTFSAVDDFGGDYSNVVHNPAFIDGKNDAAQFKRIFYNTDPDTPDNFTVIHNFEIAAYAPMKALYDSYEFEDKGKKVTLDANGVKMN